MTGTGPPRRYAEDLVVGEVVPLGSYRVTRSELLAFARQWDPQDFHVDEAAAAAGRFGDVIASGVHTLAVFQRLSALSVERDWAVIAGIRLADVRFLRPVRPDTVLAGVMQVTGMEVEVGKGRARVHKAGWLDDGGGRVLELTSEAYVRCRPETGDGG